MISKREVEHIAKLARLGLSKKELKNMQKELTVILAYVNLLKEVDVSNIEPTSHSILPGTLMREDVVKEEDVDTINKMFEQVPEKERGYVKVKGVLQ